MIFQYFEPAWIFLEIRGSSHTKLTSGGVFPPYDIATPGSLDHQDDYIFSRESHPERLFPTGQQV